MLKFSYADAREFFLSPATPSNLLFNHLLLRAVLEIPEMIVSV